MEPSFWHHRWSTNNIGFHLNEFNPLLVKYFNRLCLTKGQTVFVPLCGKTRDIIWLLSEGYKVIACELNEMAICQLFEEIEITFNIKPLINQHEKLKRYCADTITVFVGDFFDLTQEYLDQIEAIYDRAALVALPLDMRIRYSRHLVDISHQAPQLLLSFEYDQSLMAGPPFSISHEDVSFYYESVYSIDHVSTTELDGGLQGRIPAKEHVWVLD